MRIIIGLFGLSLKALIMLSKSFSLPNVQLTKKRHGYKAKIPLTERRKAIKQSILPNDRYHIGFIWLTGLIIACLIL